jgi:hypothetical protein
MCGSITVSGSSNRIALTSSRTRPRPSEIFCFSSAVRPRRGGACRLHADHLGDFVHALGDIGLGTPRLRSGKARLSRTVMVS